MGLITKKVTSLFDEHKQAEEDKIQKEQSESWIASGRGAFGTISGMASSLGFDPFRAYKNALQSGRQQIQFQIEKTFQPFLQQIEYLTNRTEADFGALFYRNQIGLTIGQGIGAIAGSVAGYLFPPLLLLLPVWEWLGGMIGVGVQENGASLDPGGYKPSGSGQYDIWDALADVNKAGGAPPLTLYKPGEAIKSPEAQYGTMATFTSGGSGTTAYNSDQMLKLADIYHWV